MSVSVPYSATGAVCWVPSGAATYAACQLAALVVDARRFQCLIQGEEIFELKLAELTSGDVAGDTAARCRVEMSCRRTRAYCGDTRASAVKDALAHKEIRCVDC